MTQPALRETTPDDLPALMALYPRAFPDEDLRPLLRALLTPPCPTLSLATVEDGALAGHILFSRCTVSGAAQGAVLLGPLAVAPTRQRRGIGGALIRAGLAQLAAQGETLALVLGDPGYYRRFGFAASSPVAPPYALPPEWAEAWMWRRLGEGAVPRGRLVPPPPWRDPALWSA